MGGCLSGEKAAHRICNNAALQMHSKCCGSHPAWAGGLRIHTRPHTRRDSRRAGNSPGTCTAYLARGRA
ncbi:hypothetical protein DENSPDRAFT_835015 [Dentipellis sp. KUC8613]|nr:hypothetical protein DENSPDRAFT_835015 [Dentipellis sp. KUC8613]